MTAVNRELLLSDAEILLDLARRGVVRVSPYRLAHEAKVPRQTVERWLAGVAVRAEADLAIKRTCGLA